MIWTPIAATLASVSSIASFLTMLSLRYRWDVRTSSIRWLFWLFFFFTSMRCAMRSVFFIWLSAQPHDALVDETAIDGWKYGQLDRLGVHSILYLRQARSIWITTVLSVGDLAWFGITLTLFPLTSELARLATVTMDRGAAKERHQIQRYGGIIFTGVGLYAIGQVVLTCIYGGYNSYSHRCLLGVYGTQLAGMGFMLCHLLRLKASGRKYEAIQGLLVPSPLYERLKRIMLVYAVCVVHFQISMILIYIQDIKPDEGALFVSGLSFVVHNMFGLILAITTSCSQECVLKLYQNWHGHGSCVHNLHMSEPFGPDLEAPPQHPVFVYTDIESSSGLWNCNSEIMRISTDIHDNIIRSAIVRYRGYEITTAGDAFQIAFRTIHDAMEFSINVQLQLLAANWPKELHTMVPATYQVRSGRRIIFNGIRVRMGVHDSAESEGKLIQDFHSVTGKATYTGVSEVIVEDVVDQARGGEILVTGRIARWLHAYHGTLSSPIVINRVGACVVPHVNTSVDLCQALPLGLSDRARVFSITPMASKLTTAAKTSSQC